MSRNIAWSATIFAATAAVLIALDWPLSFAQSPAEKPARGQPIVEQPSNGGDPPRYAGKSLPADPSRTATEKKTSPHDSPEAIYAEFVAASNEKKYSRAVACLPPEHQATVAMTVVAAALELEFDSQLAEPLRQTLATHGIDLKSLPVLSFGPERSPATFEETEATWKKEIAPRIRDVPALVADVESIFRKAAECEVPVPMWALQSATFGDQKLGFLRNLKVDGETATAAVRIQRPQAYVQNYYPDMPPQQQTAWVKITFQSIDGKWYLAKLDDIVDESANHTAPRQDVGYPLTAPPISPPVPVR